MKAVVLAGGQEFGQCLLSRQLSRSLWPLIDKPLIAHVLNVLHSAGIGDMAITANGHTSEIADRIGCQPLPGITIHYSEDPLPRGAAGCIKDCQHWLARETFLVAHGASVMIGVDLHRLLAEHRRSGAVLTLAAAGDTPHANAASATLKPAGLYVCESEILAHIRERGYQDMKEQLIPRLVEQGLKIHAVTLHGCIAPIRDEQSYLNATLQVLENAEHRERLVAHLPVRSPTVWVDPTAYVHPQARLIGPLYIGPGARVLADAAIIGPAVIGPHCAIERGATVHESILWPDTHVGQNASVVQTIAAFGARLAPGAEVRCSLVINTGFSNSQRYSLSQPGNPAAEAGLFSRWWRLVRNGLRPAAKETISSGPAKKTAPSSVMRCHG